ncbi:hypothetical protein ACFQVA_00285 [Actinomadura keratinilytica]
MSTSTPGRSPSRRRRCRGRAATTRAGRPQRLRHGRHQRPRRRRGTRSREVRPRGPAPALGEHLLVLSGHTPEALARRARDLLRLLSEEDAPDTAALCRSAAVGRDHQRHRAAVLGSGPGQLRAGLDRIARHHGDAHGTVLRDGRVVATDLGPATGAADTAPTRASPRTPRSAPTGSGPNWSCPTTA